MLKYQRRMDEPTRLEILATPDFVKSANVRTVYINDEPDHSNPYGGGGVGAKKVVRRVMPTKKMFSGNKLRKQESDSVSCSSSDDNVFIPGQQTTQDTTNVGASDAQQAEKLDPKALNRLSMVDIKKRQSMRLPPRV